MSKVARKIIHRTHSREYIWSEVYPDVFQTARTRKGMWSINDYIPFLTIKGGVVTRTQQNKHGVFVNESQVHLTKDQLDEILVIAKQMIVKIQDEKQVEETEKELANRRGGNGRFLGHETPSQTIRFLEGKTSPRLKAMQKTARQYNVTDLYSPQKGVTVTVEEIYRELNRRGK